MSDATVIHPPFGVSPVMIGLLFAHALGIGATVFRLGYRYRRHQMYWDDFWAAVAMFFDVVSTILYIVTCLVDMRDKPLAEMSFIAWGSGLFAIAEIWATRMSIAVTVVRILPLGLMHRISIAGLWAFVALWFAVSIQEVFLCGYPLPLLPYCPSASAPIVAIICNSIGSLWLIGFPAYILISTRYKLLRFSPTKMPSTHHRLLLACFSTSILLLAVNISHSVYLFSSDFDNLLITGHLEVALSLLICNILVLVTYLYRLLSDPAHPTARGSESHSSGNSKTGGNASKLFRDLTGSKKQNATEIYTSTQIYTLSEYPPSSGDKLPSKEGRASTDSMSLTSKKPQDLFRHPGDRGGV